MSKFSACKSESKIHVTGPAKIEHLSAKEPPIFHICSIIRNTVFIRIEARASISYK